ncbi:PREDICTED: lymphokine-activated killer T-cell-originated protein kinase [Ficedula albicollis]|uniref:lymphokine-activated killer T-cell-originated protein kinase n=1 Tax=Ficedula albicollis TaxID=59894 RepID=UPI000359B272|nr:PREDICTED: lymphokine-activated killer T-cell-originated protein kinase [Ficedula albicollis]
MDTFQSPTPSSRRDKADAGPASITIPASPFMQKLGFGTGVSVYLMKRSPRGLSRSPWAVKKISSSCSQSQRSLFQQRLREEAQKLRNLQHPNIVGGNSPGMERVDSHPINPIPVDPIPIPWIPFPLPWILFPLIPSLFPWISFPQLPFPWIPWIPQYLHTEQRLLHGDIKSPNVVVRGAFDAVKICDVGVSLPLDENLAVSDPELCYVGTEPWKPPEALDPDGIISDRSDIFPFGLTLWEMLALNIPHLPLSESGSEAPEALDPSQESVRELFGACTAREPRQRPAAARIVQALEGNLQP